MKVLRISGIKLSLDEKEDLLLGKVASILNIASDQIVSLEIVRKAIDARRNKPPQFVYVVKITVDEDTKLPDHLTKEIQFQEEPCLPDICLHPVKLPPENPVVVIGSGPAGLFAAYVLSSRNIPVILLERGTPVEKRVNDVQIFWKQGILNLHSNVLFGEGGAGTFSDGKLTSRSKNPLSSWVKNILVKMGAPPVILTDAKPHIGTDKLRHVIINMRKNLIHMGCRIEFEAQATDFLINQRSIEAVIVNDREEIQTNNVILAIGQSADDTYQKLFERGVQMQPKPFAMGLRVEHPQELINEIQYGKWRISPQLPPAEYFVTAAITDLNRSVYTFCMCPGGSVIACSAFEGSVITNGMSNSKRSGKFANSAIVVNVRTDDFTSHGQPLGGLCFRQLWERKAFLLAGSNYHAPVQKMIDFLAGKASNVELKTSYLPGVANCMLEEILPDFVADALKKGIREINNKMPGFISEEAHLIGVETRTSSPVRICRRSDGQSENTAGIYPCGEGSGYAGGIISSALDGIKAAQNLVENLKNRTGIKDA